ncbi:PhzF family phenazine biosynthesis protein [Paracraurococcus lichenis]|uniref:PhzF family phenazine biosynthesis protein n=1 Tax=Paracraurococcus lichenis TaxID=3064888 RepID=A0ABT9DV69_9PROT|nr:PhzF family phenazine biosynthesis protein [Paracraurococcus sp. LOR1-02]MDO9707773.1 PhzF family phenazine biosynthesis protein [Paracraurococcus sp. LOR1-02]
MQLEFETCDVFTEARFGGNPLAVVHGGEGLDGAAMQRVAREFNLSETVFVLPAEAAGAVARIRIFTPGAEIPFAGHPNVGTAVMLARRFGVTGDSLALDQAAGRVVARLSRDAAGLVVTAEIEAPLPFATTAHPAAEAVAECLGLPASAVLTTTHAPVIGGCGNSMAFAELADLSALAAATPDIAGFRRHLPASACVGIHLHVALPDGRRRARMFGPLVGVPEDPATGSANVGLAGLLLHASGGERLAFEVEQGIEMGRPSRLALRAWRDGSGAIRAAVGGGVVAVSEGRITVT